MSTPSLLFLSAGSSGARGSALTSREFENSL